MIDPCSRDVSSFSDQRRARDDLPPAAAISRVLRPVAPEAERVLERRGHVAIRERRLLAGVEHEIGRLAGFEREDRAGTVLVERDRDRPRQSQPEHRGLELHAALDHAPVSGLARIVEPRRAAHPEAHTAARRGDAPDQLAEPAIPAMRRHHRVGDLDTPAVGEKAGHQDVGVRDVALHRPRVVEFRLDREAAAVRLVEQRREHRRAVEARPAEKGDRAAGRDERDRGTVADDAVLLDRPLRGRWRPVRDVSHCRGTRGKASCRRRRTTWFRPRSRSRPRRGRPPPGRHPRPRRCGHKGSGAARGARRRRKARPG